MRNQINKLPLKLLVVIADWKQLAKISEVFMNVPLHFCYISKADGTASSDILDMLGLGNIDKMLALCITTQQNAMTLLEMMNDIFHIKEKGMGIAFTIPLAGISANILNILNEKLREKLITHIHKMKDEGENMKNESSQALIMSIVNQGYREELMETAKSAGAPGGTVITARRIGLEGQINILGLPVEAEKEIIMILVDKENKIKIMEAISQKYGIESEAHGITIALPVDNVIGLEK